jgi:hypothetical protein
MKKFNGYEDEDGVYLCEAGNEKLLGAPTDILIFTIECETWEEACQKWYDFQGWGEYKPFK